MRTTAGVLLVLALVFPACGGNRSPASPGPAGKKAAIVITTFTADAQWSGTVYQIKFGIAESNGVGATITGIDFTFLGPDGPMFTAPCPVFVNDRIAANGGLGAASFTIYNSNGTLRLPVATGVQANVTFVDDNHNAGAVRRSAGVPALVVPAVSYFTAEPAVANAGDPITLRWGIQSATAAFISPGIGVVSSTGGTVSTIAATPSVASPAAVTYTLSANNTGGTIYGSATVMVTHGPVPDVEYRWFKADDPARQSYGIDHLGLWDEYERAIDHDMNWPVPYWYRFWGARPGRPLLAEIWVWNNVFCVKVQIYKRGALYAEGNSCTPTNGVPRSGWVTVTGTF